MATAKQQRDRRHDAKRRAEKPWRAWYSEALWRGIRSAQLRAEPLCRRCKDAGRVVEATVCNHIEPHRGDRTKFLAGPFESLCKSCHDSDAQFAETHGFSKTIGHDGWPVDERHPFNSNKSR